MKTRNLMIFIILVLILLMLSGCDMLGLGSSNGSSSDDSDNGSNIAYVRFYTEVASSYNYCAVGTYSYTYNSTDYYDVESSWLYSNGYYSSYITVYAGSYYVLFDSDAYHSTFAPSTYTYSLEGGEYYRVVMYYDNTFDVFQE